jgi:hypothetical protein
MIDLFGIEVDKIIEGIVKTPSVKPKTTRAKKEKEPTISDLRFKQEESLKCLRELEAQDETNFTDFETSSRGNL